MTLEEIIKPLHEMSDDEILERIRQVRSGRREPNLKKPSKKQVEKKQTKGLMESLTPAQAAAILKQLEG